MSGRLVIFEDHRWRSLRPLTDLTPVPALAFGASDLATRWRRAVGAPLLGIEARAELLSAWRDRPVAEATAPGARDEVLVVNAAALPGPWLKGALESPAPARFIGAGRIAGARLEFDRVSPGLGRGAEFERFLVTLPLLEIPVEAAFLEHPWDFIERNPEAIAEDLAEVGELRGELHPSAVLLEPARITVMPGARVEALAVLDARGGPIRIGPRARVMTHTVVSGPCAVGAGTQLMGGSIARSTFGPECRIAGEVEASVWQGYANKRHHGFVGHSVIGEWVNLGALTTTSDLKNNYGPVRVRVDGAEVDSGLTKVGALIGAHVKTGIGTLLPTGASIGAGSNLFAGGRFAPRALPAFAWWDGEALVEHHFEKFLATARTAMARRERPMLPADEAALRACFEATVGERRAREAAS